MTTEVRARPTRTPRGERQKLTAVTGLAALSLDALSSVAYGPESIVLALVAAGQAATAATLPISVAIAALLLVLVLSYRQVIAVHPDGGGAYAVAKADLSRFTALLAAASLVVDYVLTVAVSLAAGAASLASAFPALGPHLLAMSLIGLLVLTVVNLRGIVESAALVIAPTIVFVVAVGAAAILAILRPGAATVGHALGPIHPVEALGVVLVLKAFAAGCSALTGVEAIANGVPAFRAPAVRRAQRTEVSLGVLLGALLVLLAIAISVHHLVPRGGVTILAQVTAIAFGTGWPYVVTNLAVTLVLALAANTSFGGLPVLMSLLARDNRLPHIFGLRAERPVYRYGVLALALLAGVLLAVLGADTARLLPLFAIGVFIGFTISQGGLVLHWLRRRPDRWRPRAALNGLGAVLSALAAVVFLASKFTAGAWLLLILVPALMLLFARVQGYYDAVAVELGLGRVPAHPTGAHGLVVVPVSSITASTERALSAALAMSGGGSCEVVAVTADTGGDLEDFRTQWAQWDPGIELVVVPSPHRGLVAPLVSWVRDRTAEGRVVTVLIVELQPHRKRHEILHNQRGLVLATVLRARTDAVVATLPYRLETDAPRHRAHSDRP